MKPYQDPEPRRHLEWCYALGFVCEGVGCNTDKILTYEEFCYLPETKLVKVEAGPLYGFWKQYGDVYGEARTVREWLADTNQHIVEPLTGEDIRDLDLFLGHDEFWTWGSGKMDINGSANNENSLSKMLANWLRRLFCQSFGKQHE